jgi:hypothetical protein
MLVSSMSAALDPATRDDDKLVEAMRAQGVSQLCVLLHVENGDPKTARLMSSTGSAFFDGKLIASLRAQNRLIFATDGGGAIERYPGKVWEHRKSISAGVPGSGKSLGCAPEEIGT